VGVLFAYLKFSGQIFGEQKFGSEFGYWHQLGDLLKLFSTFAVGQDGIGCDACTL